MGVTGVTVLSLYGIVTTITIIVLGVILKYDVELVDEDCEEVHMGDGGDLTEIHNKVIKVDFLNNDQAETGRIDSEGGLVCSPCSFSTFTALEIVAITLLVVGILTNTGRLLRYVIKLMKKRQLRSKSFLTDWLKIMETKWQMHCLDLPRAWDGRKLGQIRFCQFLVFLHNVFT